MQWRTLILVNPALRGVHALSFPGQFVGSPPYRENLPAKLYLIMWGGLRLEEIH